MLRLSNRPWHSAEAVSDFVALARDMMEILDGKLQQKRGLFPNYKNRFCGTDMDMFQFISKFFSTNKIMVFTVKQY